MESIMRVSANCVLIKSNDRDKLTVMHDLKEVGKHFHIPGKFIQAVPYGSGHINDTYAASYDQAGSRVRYIHQRINQLVFVRPDRLMENVARVTRHQAKKLQQQSHQDTDRRALTLIPSIEEKPYWIDPEENYWRTYVFIEKARTYDIVETPQQAFEAARAFGTFQKYLVDLPGPQLHETIPDFHHTRKRFERLQLAAGKDTCNRVVEANKELEFVYARENIVSTLLDLHATDQLPSRITHNDTKLNNVMIDDETGEGICVIDLDTVMPGLALYDFGDMVRTATSPAPEDEQELDKVTMRLEMFDALANGYVSTAGEFLNQAEREHLAFSGKLITLEIGIRFLTDYLEGDNYFKTHRKGHNLDRCRAQFKLLQSMEDQEELMHKTVQDALRKYA